MKSKITKSETKIVGLTSEVIEGNPPGIKYPCLKIAENGEVVLFNERSTGIRLTNHFWLGGYSDFDHVFKPFHGEVRLIQDGVRRDKNGDIIFPCLMTAPNGSIVLFNGPKRGVSVMEDEYKFRTIGFYAETWHIDNFTDFSGTVTLSNDYEALGGNH